MAVLYNGTIWVTSHHSGYLYKVKNETKENVVLAKLILHLGEHARRAP
jgi:hypothetical protein